MIRPESGRPQVTRHGWAFLLASLLPASAQAEVIDKVLPIAILSPVNLLPTLLAGVAARYRPGMLLLILPLSGVFLYSVLADWLDPALAAALLREGGLPYQLASACGPALLPIAVIIGSMWRRKAHTHKVIQP
ncbi:hypothetical protein [Chitinilyticum litopenaei]|uniref:hypothetical protein n=1 Tax=Chitinilyticum litopenaei TaxID=1121276 RepID=UPI0003F5A863|nr:hypothetical protein [Chitinilyticum litopenaei]